MTKIFILLAALALAMLPGRAAKAAPAGTDITYYGHSAVRIVTPGGKVLLIDPWISNPNNKEGDKELETLKKVDLILLTHGHGDHVGNAVEIARKSGAKLVSTPELMKSLIMYSNFPEAQTSNTLTGSFGGEIDLLDGEVRVLFVPAVHGSSMEIAEGSAMPRSLVFAGNPGGFVVSVRNGPRIYHTGDTDLFGDMAFLANVDVMFVCIGDKFTMGPQRAAQAVRLVKPKTAIPMHYGTWPVLTGTPERFKGELEHIGLGKRYRLVKTGETLAWK
jgi:L-ascorbate metabolism protein UlaG (beta-lactamase superfamily)